MTTTNYKKKLIEVAIPLEAINAASAREKSIRHGHPSTLHLWWARRPLAACRAVLFAQLVDDPSSHPDKFPTEDAVEAERKRLFEIIEELVKWENSTNEGVLERARAEIRKSCGGKLPPVYDPFSGGCSIPLEAQRLGLPAYGSDLNPVAVMIGKAMIEIPPKFKEQSPIHPGPKERTHYRKAEGLAEDVKYYGEWMRERAWMEIGQLYPAISLPKEYGAGSATIIAWIWARTVPSPDPAFADVEVPLVSSFLLSSKSGNEVWLEPVVDKSQKTITFSVRKDGSKEDIAKAAEGTKASGRGANFLCLLSGAAITADYIRRCGQNGKISQTLMAIVAEGDRGRLFLPPLQIQEKIALDVVAKEKPRHHFEPNALGFRIGNYGMKSFGDLFTERQAVGLNCFIGILDELREIVRKDACSAGMADRGASLRDGGNGADAYAEAVSVYLAFAITKMADRGSTICTWDASRSSLRNTFGRQAIPMTWDFAESNPFSGSTGSWSSCVEWTWKALEVFTPYGEGSEAQYDAQSVVYPSGAVVSTDPPYYDNIGYADLSDFFFGWMRLALRSVYPDLFGLLATPKEEELVATPCRHGGRDAAESFFLNGMKKAIHRMATGSSNLAPATIYYAFKQSEIESEGISSTGWATFLDAVFSSGYQIVGTWPLRTELANRMRGNASNALANSVVLVCRKRESNAETISRAEFIRALKRELPEAISELQAANIAPADMPQSAIGPGMGIFSRYKAVLESDDNPMSVKTALQLINHELDEYLGGIQGEFDADTRFAITWFEQFGLGKGDFGVANSIAQARGISVDSVKHAGIAESSAGKVRILKREELADDWEPASDTHITIWECLQYLVRQHEKDGISTETGVLLKKIGSDRAEAVKDLAYCLYDICSNKRKDAKEATAYNALIADWTDLTRMAASVHDTRRDGQMRMEI